MPTKFGSGAMQFFSARCIRRCIRRRIRASVATPHPRRGQRFGLYLTWQGATFMPRYHCARYKFYLYLLNVLNLVYLVYCGKAPPVYCGSAMQLLMHVSPAAVPSSQRSAQHPRHPPFAAQPQPGGRSAKLASLLRAQGGCADLPSPVNTTFSNLIMVQLCLPSRWSSHSKRTTCPRA